MINPEYYTKEVDVAEFESVLDSWFDTLNTEQSECRRIPAPKEQELLILSAIYYEDTDYLFKSNMTSEQVEERYSFTKKEDLDWILDVSLPQDEFEKAYMTFLKNHFGNMEKVLKDHFEQI